MEKKKYTLLVVGSARIDGFMNIPDDRAKQLCNIDTKKCVVELTYAAKIPMKSVDFLLGGNGANVAVGTKRLGINSALVAEVGSGLMGDHTKQELSREIDTQFVSQTEDVPAGFGAVIVYQGERTILSYYPPIVPKFPGDECESEWIYLTSTGEKFAEYYEEIYTFIKQTGARVAFNPGGRQIKKGIAWMKKYLEITEILIVNREEAEEISRLSGTYGKEKYLIDTLREYGVKKIVVTDGTAGSFAFDGEKYLHCGVLPIDAIERTGAGDASSAALLAALIKGKTMSEALIWATSNSASVIGYVGPQPGLLREEKMQEWLARARSSEVRVQEL